MVVDTVLDEGVWLQRRQAHVARVGAWLAQHRERRSRGIEHPVEDFLFEYYTFRPYQLRRWQPGHGVVLAGAAAEELLTWRDYVRDERGVILDTAAVVAVRGHTVRWVHELLSRTAERPGHFGCFGMREWAMVYRSTPGDLRHPAGPPAQRAAAHPGQPAGPGAARCLHANMDLYKHAYKLSPLVPSDLVADTFALARDIRELDMRASPYDLSGLGFEPVAIETAEGRAAYAMAQRDFSVRSAVLRHELIDVLGRVLADAGANFRTVEPVGD